MGCNIVQSTQLFNNWRHSLHVYTIVICQAQVQLWIAYAIKLSLALLLLSNISPTMGRLEPTTNKLPSIRFKYWFRLNNY